jgi:hypothetical protein
MNISRIQRLAQNELKLEGIYYKIRDNIYSCMDYLFLYSNIQSRIILINEFNFIQIWIENIGTGGGCSEENIELVNNELMYIQIFFIL